MQNTDVKPPVIAAVIIAAVLLVGIAGYLLTSGRDKTALQPAQPTAGSLPPPRPPAGEEGKVRTTPPKELPASQPMTPNTGVL